MCDRKKSLRDYLSALPNSMDITELFHCSQHFSTFSTATLRSSLLTTAPPLLYLYYCHMEALDKAKTCGKIIFSIAFIWMKRDTRKCFYLVLKCLQVLGGLPYTLTMFHREEEDDNNDPENDWRGRSNNTPAGDGEPSKGGAVITHVLKKRPQLVVWSWQL